MKKLFTLAAAVLASFSLWAVVPASTLDPTDVPTEGWAGKYAPAAIVNGDWVCFSPYEIYQSSSQTWAAKDAGGSTDGSWDATDPFPAQSAWTTNDGKVATVRQGQKGPYYYRITNTTDVAALVKSGSNKKRTVFLEAYELTNGEAPATPTKSISMESSTMAVIALNELDATKEYMIVVRAEDTGTGGSSAGNSNYYAIGFKAVTKTIVSTVETLTAVTINDVAISAADLASLVSNKYLFLQDAYVTAPVVKFTKHTVITYDDQSTKEKDEVIEVTSQPATTTWGASATINGDAYYVYAPKAAGRTVTYMYGEQVLGTETVAVNGNPAEYAQYETMPLATFGGWYKDADFTQAVANIAAEVISVDVTYYAKFTKAYLSQNVNIEQLVLDYGTSYDIRSALTAAGWAYKDLNDLDTLNDIENKTNRNEAFLGLKLKTAGAYVQCWLQVGSRLDVKFGNVGCNVTLNLHGEMGDVNATYTKDDLASTNNIVSIFGQPDDKLVTFTTTGSSTVVLKQLILNGTIAEVTLPAPGAYLVTCAEAEHGTVEATWPNKKYRTPVGETVTLNVTPEEGYQVASITVDGEPLADVEGVYSFIMPAKEVTVSATFEVDPTTGINNTNEAVKAVKVVRNGQLFIEKNGVVYNAQGAIVK